MGEESIKSKKKVFNLLQQLIETEKKVLVWAIWGGLLFLTVIFDCIKKPYVNSDLEYIFSYDIGSLVAIIVVIWTFTVTVGMYCVSQLETKYYEVRLVDVFFGTFSFGGAFAIVFAVAGEMLLLIVSTIMRWKITIVAIAVLQFYTTCFVFALVCLYFTKSAIILMAQEEIRNVLETTVLPFQVEQKMKVSLKVAQNTDYENIDEKDSLFDLLKMISSGEVRGLNHANKNKLKRELSKIFVKGMLDSKADYWAEVYPIISKWFRFSKDIEVNKGIIQALAENHREDRHQHYYNSCIDLIECRNPETSLEEIGLWMLACYWYCSDPNDFPGQNWKDMYCMDIVNKFPEILQPDKVNKYLAEYCRLLNINRIDLENHIGYCEEGWDKNG